jgi:hypothetical protein
MKHLALIFLLALAQAVSAGQLDQAPFDVVVPKIELRNQSLEECLAIVRKHLPADYPISYVADPTKLPGFSGQTLPEPSAELRKVTLITTDGPLGRILRSIANAAGARISCTSKAITIYPDIGTIEPFVKKSYPRNSPETNVELSNIPIYTKTKIDYSDGYIHFTAPIEVHEKLASLVD